MTDAKFGLISPPRIASDIIMLLAQGRSISKLDSQLTGTV